MVLRSINVRFTNDFNTIVLPAIILTLVNVPNSSFSFSCIVNNRSKKTDASNPFFADLYTFNVWENQNQSLRKNPANF